MLARTRALAGFLLALAEASATGQGKESALIPQIDGGWWTVAGDPDLGPLTDPRQQPVDFSIWRAADGTWQLWSCIRHTRCGGKTRLFHRWEGKNLTDPDWRPMGIAMQADPGVGETPGGLQAPHVIRIGDLYHMFYGDWESICHATSQDGKAFTRVLQPSGRTGMFSEGKGNNTRDPMVLPVGDLFHVYYTAFPGQKGSVYCRTSRDLAVWGDSKIVAFGGSAGTNPFSAECPFVVHRPESRPYAPRGDASPDAPRPSHPPESRPYAPRGDASPDAPRPSPSSSLRSAWGRSVLDAPRPSSDWYYLFRTQRYGADAQTSVYRSTDPLDFGIEDDRCLVCRLPIAAPEIIQHEGRDYLAALLPSLKGIRIARLKWVPKP